MNELVHHLTTLPPLKALFLFKQLKDAKFKNPTDIYFNPTDVILVIKTTNPSFFEDLKKFKADSGYGIECGEFNYELAKQQPEWQEMIDLLTSLDLTKQ